MEPTTLHRCTGSCGGVTDQEGLNCSLEGCDKQGQPLTAVTQCDACAEASAGDGKPHACDGCEAC